jgi:hypothetical protein
MKPVVWFAGLIVLIAFLFPNGLPLTFPARPVTPVTPVVPEPPAPVIETDAAVLETLKPATAVDRAHIAGTYLGAIDVLRRDNGKLIKTTEQWATYQARMLNLSVDGTAIKGKYPGLDVAIDNVFVRLLGTTQGANDVLAVNADVLAKLVKACEIVANSAQK